MDFAHDFARTSAAGSPPSLVETPSPAYSGQVDLLLASADLGSSKVMKTYTINQRPFEFDEAVKYADFFICRGERMLVEIDWHELLRRLESGDQDWNGVSREVLLLTRWVHEAPRKRFYHELGSDPRVMVASGEEFFIGNPQGPAIIDALERTGQVASALCRHHGLDPLKPMKHDLPDPVPTDKLVPSQEDMPEGRLPDPKELP